MRFTIDVSNCREGTIDVLKYIRMSIQNGESFMDTGLSETLDDGTTMYVIHQTSGTPE